MCPWLRVSRPPGPAPLESISPFLCPQTGCSRGPGSPGGQFAKRRANKGAASSPHSNTQPGLCNNHLFMTVSNSTGGNTVIEPAATGKRLGQRGKKPDGKVVRSFQLCLSHRPPHPTLPPHPWKGIGQQKSCFWQPFPTGFFNILATLGIHFCFYLLFIYFRFCF